MSKQREHSPACYDETGSYSGCVCPIPHRAPHPPAEPQAESVPIEDYVEAAMKYRPPSEKDARALIAEVRRLREEERDDQDAACRLEELRVKLHLTEGSPEEIAGTIATILDLDAEAIQAERARAQAADQALREIEALEPRLFDGFPADWSEQIAACAECQRYKSHPIQQGICDEHRRPLWDRQRHDADEIRAIGYRAKLLARTALAAPGHQGEEGK